MKQLFGVNIPQILIKEEAKANKMTPQQQQQQQYNSRNEIMLQYQKQLDTHQANQQPEQQQLLPPLTHMAMFYLTSLYIDTQQLQFLPFNHQHDSPNNPNLPAILNIFSSNSLMPDLIALCDSFDHSNTVLASTVGAFSGNTVYESLWQNAVVYSENNKQAPFEGYNQSIGPRLDKELLIKGRNEQLALRKQIFGDQPPQQYTMPPQPANIVYGKTHVAKL